MGQSAEQNRSRGWGGGAVGMGRATSTSHLVWSGFLPVGHQVLTSVPGPGVPWVDYLGDTLTHQE